MSRAKPLIPLQEDIDGWLQTLNRWYNSYRAAVGSVHYDFVVRVAKQDWLRTRAQNDFNRVLQSIGDRLPTEWTREEIKMHDRAWRYKTQADLAFSKEYRLLARFYKDHPPPLRPTAKPHEYMGKLDPAVELKEIIEEPLTGLALWNNTKLVN